MGLTHSKNLLKNPVGYEVKQLQKEASKQALEIAKAQKKPIKYLIQKPK